MADVFDVAEYLLAKSGEITAMKLQKLVYYCQAWHLVWDGVPLFDDVIEAWANGPVVPVLYEAHKGVFKVGPGFFREALKDPEVLERVRLSREASAQRATKSAEESELVATIDVEGLATALVERSHEPSFEDSTAGMDAARETARQLIRTYMPPGTPEGALSPRCETRTQPTGNDVEWIRDGVCLLCGDGVLNSGEHLDPERHAAEVERFLAGEVGRPTGAPDAVTHDDERKGTHL